MSLKMNPPLLYCGNQIKKCIKLVRAIPEIVLRGGGFIQTIKTGFHVAATEGAAGIIQRIRRVVIQLPTAKPLLQIKPEFNADEFLSVRPYYLNHNFAVVQTVESTFSIAIHVYLQSQNCLDELTQYISSIPYAFDLFVSTPASLDVHSVKGFFEKNLPQASMVTVEMLPNVGCGVVPLIIQFGGRLVNYDIVSHIDAQIDSLTNQLSEQCTQALRVLYGMQKSNHKGMAELFDLLNSDAKIIYAAIDNKGLQEKSKWAGNALIADELLKKYTKYTYEDLPPIEFPEGGVFWAKTECIRDFLLLPLKYDDFTLNSAESVISLAHALEKLVLVFAMSSKGFCYRIHQSDSIADYLEYEEQQDFSNKITHNSVKVLSYYLPQFHPIPENDEWHGVGFTEWTKVRAANPLFSGHYQQHIPHPDIGYYLLDSPETFKKQADMMKKSGVFGQIFYHYWFTGKLILEDPAKMLLENKDIDMPFCFCWANENWTRRWDGNESEILLGQNYSNQDAKGFIEYLIPFFKDERYIKIDNRPVLYIYRPASIKDIGAYLDVWRAECAKHDVNPPYVVAVLTRGATNPNDFGLDAGVERVLHDWTDGAAPNIKNDLKAYQQMSGSVLRYNDVADFYINQIENPEFTYFRSLVPVWDNTARYGTKAFLLHNCTTQKFQEWMQSLIRYTEKYLPIDRQFLIVNAWNEWAEGAHLEPDTKYGYGYLNAIGRAMSDTPVRNLEYRQQSLPSNVSITIKVSDVANQALKLDQRIHQKFIHCLAHSTIFERCHVHIVDVKLIESLLLVNSQLKVGKNNIEPYNYILTIQHVSYFLENTIEDMLRMAVYHKTSLVISNSYGDGNEDQSVCENGSVDQSQAYSNPLVLQPSKSDKIKNVKHCYQAKAFVTTLSKNDAIDLPHVTTIIRVHKNANLNIMMNALLSLLAQQGCIVTPLIAAQDLSDIQKNQLEKLIKTLPWDLNATPIIQYYTSENGVADLRSKMLNESLKSVATQYAAFLDYDDLLLPHAYQWLTERLSKTKKAVSFGRVYFSLYNNALERIIERQEKYEYGLSFEDFISVNHAPIHSFMLDLSQIDLSNIKYYDEQKYMEDYLLTLQIFTKENCDWDSLKINHYIGDYIHSIDRKHTLGIACDVERNSLLKDEVYLACESRIKELQMKLKVP